MKYLVPYTNQRVGREAYVDYLEHCAKLWEREKAPEEAARCRAKAREIQEKRS